jgi:hypothetical protein
VSSLVRETRLITSDAFSTGYLTFVIAYQSKNLVESQYP